MLRFRSLGSGSSGNATLVEAGDGTRRTRVLIDCGLGIRQLEQRLAASGVEPNGIDALFITHEHADHIGCAQSLAQRWRVPVWMSRGTHQALGSPGWDGMVREARDGLTIEVGALQLRPMTVPHDAREPLQLTLGDGAVTLGVLTDLGHATAHVAQRLAGCDALLLECNHDSALLDSGPYPPFLKRRVGGPWGHLANEAAAELLRGIAHAGLRHVVAAHLSEQNNRPELARRALAQVLNCADEEIVVADGPSGCGWLTV